MNLNTALICISLATLLLSCAQLGGREGGGAASVLHPLGRWGTIPERKSIDPRGRTDDALDMGSMRREFEGMKANLWQIISYRAKEPVD